MTDLSAPQTWNPVGRSVAHRPYLRPGMEVLGCDGGSLGVVLGVSAGHVRVVDAEGAVMAIDRSRFRIGSSAFVMVNETSGRLRAQSITHRLRKVQ